MQHRQPSLAAHILTIAVALTFAAAVCGAQVVIPERAVSAPSYRPAVFDQSLPSVASDGENFLAVWLDWRGLPLFELYAARISAAGELLDPTGIRLGQLGSQPAVVFAGDAYAVFWTTASTLYTLRLSRDGQVIDGPRAVVSGVDPYFPYSAASNGRRIVLASRDHLLLLDDHAVFIERIPAGAGNSLGWPTAIASNGSSFLVAWGVSFSDFTTMVMPLDASGHPSSPARPAGAYGFHPKIASDGRDFLLVVPHQPNLATAFGVTAAGEPSAPQTLSIHEVGNVGWDGSEYVHLARATPSATNPQILDALRLDRSGKPLDSAPLPLAEMRVVGGSVVTATAGGRMLAIYDGQKSDSDDSSDIRGSLIDAGQLAAAKELLVARSAAMQNNPLIASSGSNILVVWSEGVASYMNLFSTDGTPRFTDGVRLPLFARAVVFDGTNYVVAGGSSPFATGTYAMRIAADSGALLDGAAVKINNETVVGAGTDGAGTLLATSASIASPGMSVTRLDHALAATGSVLAAPDYANKASIAWDGAEWLIAYEKPVQSLLIEPGSDVRAVRVSPALTPLDPTPIVFAAPGTNSRPIAASDGDGFAVFWTQGGTKGRRIGRDGNPLGNPVLLATGTLYDARWDGRRFALAITGTRTYVTHVSPALQPAGGIALLTTDAARAPTLALTADGLIAAYMRRAMEPLYGGVYRAFIRTPVTTSAARVRAVAP